MGHPILPNQALSNWLEQSLDRIAASGGKLGPIIAEGILRAATTGQTEMLESVLGSAALNAAVAGEPISFTLKSLQAINQVILERLEDEIDPSVAWEMLYTLGEIFGQSTRFATDAYAQALNDLHDQKLVASVKAYQEAEQQVYQYATDLSRANRELAKLEQAKTDFISIAAHELKTPLSVIVGFVKILDEQGLEILAQEGDTILKGIISGTERLELIINNLLDISALETETLILNCAPVSVGSLVKTVVDQSAAEAQTRQHKFRVNIAANVPQIVSDAKRLHQVLEHLIINAIKFTPDGGQITINVSVKTADAGDNAPANATEADSMAIEIRDTGIGIAPEDREQIFDKFYRVGQSNLHSSGRIKFKGAGPGLGLSIAKGIIEALQGRIWVESPGHDEVNCPGAAFHIRLPFAI